MAGGASCGSNWVPVTPRPMESAAMASRQQVQTVCENRVFRGMVEQDRFERLSNEVES